MKTTDRNEFAPVRHALQEAQARFEAARQRAIAGVDEELYSLRAQVAKKESEREALTKLTGAAAVREMLPPLPPAPNRFDCRECGQGVAADEDGCCATCGRDCAAFEDGVCVVPFPEEEETAKAPYIEALAQQSPPAPPALLDLRTVKMGHSGSIIEADGDLCDCGESTPLIKKGERFIVERTAKEFGDGPRVKVEVIATGYQCFIAALQPARVVKHACPRCDEGMREIEFTRDVEWPGWGVAHKGMRAKAAVVKPGEVQLDEKRIVLFSAYRFVRADVPPPSEWCRGVE